MTPTEKQDIINGEVVVSTTSGTEQQVTTPTPARKPNTKNPKRVAAGKLVAKRTRLARKAQKKALAEANVIIEKNKADKAAAKASSGKAERLPPIPKEPEPARQGQQQPVFTTGQWIAIVGIGVTLVTAYVKREDLKALYKRYTTTKPPPEQQHHQQAPQQALQQQKRPNNLRKMD